MIRNKPPEGLKEAAEYAAKKIAEKLEEMGLDVAHNETEALILVGRSLNQMDLKIGNVNVKATVLSTVLYASQIWNNAAKYKKYKTILIEERAEIEQLGKTYKTKARSKLYNKWQGEWTKYQGWTKHFIKDVERWNTRKWGALRYYMSQAFTSHGIFCTYLNKIGNSD